MWAAVSTAFTAIIGFFTEIFEFVTSEDVVPWVIIGVAVPLLGFLVSLFKRLIWGSN